MLFHPPPPPSLSEAESNTKTQSPPGTDMRTRESYGYDNQHRRLTGCRGRWKAARGANMNSSAHEDAAAFMLLAGMMHLGMDDHSSLLDALGLADYNQAADFLDGTARTGRSVPHADRWWEKSGRHLSSAQFRTAFR
ncbi:unnamed protein product, partial [Ectocarpus sp. 12 AP-2014]